jgi:hypothetical protein
MKDNGDCRTTETIQLTCFVRWEYISKSHHELNQCNLQLDFRSSPSESHRSDTGLANTNAASEQEIARRSRSHGSIKRSGHFRPEALGA